MSSFALVLLAVNVVAFKEAQNVYKNLLLLFAVGNKCNVVYSHFPTNNVDTTGRAAGGGRRLLVAIVDFPHISAAAVVTTHVRYTVCVCVQHIYHTVLYVGGGRRNIREREGEYIALFVVLVMILISKTYG